MEISRRGAFKDHGSSKVTLKKLRFEWHQRVDHELWMRQDSGVKDFNTDSKHTYLLRMAPAEITQMLTVLAASALEDPAIFEEDFADALKPLIQLTHVVSGVRK